MNRRLLRSIGHVGAGITLFVATAIPAHAQQSTTSPVPSAEELQQWLEEEMQAAQEYPPIDGLSIEFHLEIHAPMDPAELARKRKLIEGKPDHPLRWEVEQAARYAEYGAEIVRMRVWSNGEGRFRYNHDWDPVEIEPFADIVRTSSQEWTLGQTQFQLYDPPKPASSQSSFDAMEHGGFARRIKLLMYGGLNEISVAPVTTDAIHLMGDTFEATMGSDPGASARVRGYWSADDGRWFIRDFMYLTSGNPDSIGQLNTFSDWTFEPLLGAWIAHRREKNNTKGELIQLTVFDAVRPLESGEFERVTKAPWFGGHDAIRGDITAEDAWDHRGGQMQYLQPVAGNSVNRQRIANAPPLPPPATPARSVRKWQILGWSVAGGFLVLVVILRFVFSVGKR